MASDKEILFNVRTRLNDLVDAYNKLGYDARLSREVLVVLEAKLHGIIEGLDELVPDAVQQELPF